MKTLVIVESPTKAKTIAKFLGKDFHVESSMGHVRDLPKSKMGIDIDGGTFLPEYEIPATKKKKVSDLKKLAKEADTLYFATDTDREGEAISWHLAELLNVKPSTVQRLVFHEITKHAIDEALAHPRPLDTHLVDAQQARRVLDRLVGYEISPVLWKKIKYGLSAGRVQSVAVHLIVEREKERAAFRASTYYDLLATLAANEHSFAARLISYKNLPIPAAKDFDSTTGKAKNPEKIALLNEANAKALAGQLLAARPWQVTSVEETPYQTHPYPPFITSTLQQEGGRKLGWSAKQTMRTAQSLYEQGYITYMRTDSVHLSEQAVNAAREAANEFGKEYVAPTAKQFAVTSKLAQEAHEAIRPAGASFKHPEEVRKEVTSEEAKLYDLIWKRTVATQMKSAQLVRISAQITVADAVFEAKGKRIEFAGYLRAYVEGADDPEAELEDKEVALPPLKKDQEVTPTEVAAEVHTTTPPARFTEASLIKKLEAEGVGRPSTYATIMDTILEREYVARREQALVPTFMGMIVDDFLQKHFAPLVDAGFTASMEEDLDRIARGEEDWQPYIKNFYGQNSTFALHPSVEKAINESTYPVLDIGTDPETGKKIILKSGKFGPYLERDSDSEEKDTASLPDTLPPADLTIDEAVKILNRPQGPQIIGTDPTTGLAITYRTGRFGPYVQLGEDEEKKKAKKVGLTFGPKHIPISTRVSVENPSLEDAVALLSLPRPLGNDIVAGFGRFGPYVKRGDDFRSVPKDQDILTITLADAEALFAQEKKGRGRRQAKVLRELGVDPAKKPIQILDGKYGPYISNGTRTFVSVPKEQAVESITLEQALQMLAEKKGKKRSKKQASAE